MSNLKVAWADFKNGLVVENPLLVLMIGLCSALAVSSRLENTIFMGVAATFVLVCSNAIVSLIKKVTPPTIRIPIFIVIIASFVTIVDLSMKGYFPAAYERLGVWIPLIVVNCMILGRAEAFAYGNSIFRSVADGLGIGAGYTMVLMIMGFVRELLGSGKIILFDSTVLSLGSAYIKDPIRILVFFPGAFLVFGFLIGALNIVRQKREQK
ncbi:MAG: RnfABCDGE type electron transport complex subunit E [Actinobacteria bacterium]|nr:MAG: RnfABCDGE type electron transport complex subunit E [Actinomycetota bacterium]